MAGSTDAKTTATEAGCRRRVCANCERWVYYDNGDCGFHCSCNAGWKLVEVSLKSSAASALMEIQSDRQNHRDADRSVS